jgi:hypothetical protein
MRRAHPVLLAVWISAMLVATSAAFALSTAVMSADRTDHVGRFQPIGHRAQARPTGASSPSTREPVESHVTTSTSGEHARTDTTSTEPTEARPEAPHLSPPTTTTMRTTTSADDHGSEERSGSDDGADD